MVAILASRPSPAQGQLLTTIRRLQQTPQHYFAQPNMFVHLQGTVCLSENGILGLVMTRGPDPSLRGTHGRSNVEPSLLLRMMSTAYSLECSLFPSSHGPLGNGQVI